MPLPSEGYLRIHQIIGCRKRGITAIIPVSASTWWKGVRSGRFPAGQTLPGGRMRVWDVAEIREYLASGGAR
jgi:predicted DNA-binding transcriptional regulator AlpA